MEPDSRRDEGILMIDVLFHFLDAPPEAFQKGIVDLFGGDVHHPHLQHSSSLPEFDQGIPFDLKPGPDGEIQGFDIREKVHLLDVDAVAHFDFDQAHDIQDAKGLSQGVPADVKLLCQAPFGRQAVSRGVFLL